jgi:uncharacterized membrane protein
MIADERGTESAEEKGLDRILALSDGVFAFAITLLVLSLTVPTLTGEKNSLNLLGSLAGELPTFYTYALSFFVISVWWVAHHRLFRYIKRYTTTLMWLNLFFLLFITIIPFLTEILDQYGSIQAALIIYDLTQLFGGLALYAIWTYATGHHMIDSKTLSRSQIRNIRIRSLVPSLIFLLAIAISFVLPQGTPPSTANFALFCMFPLLRIAARKTSIEE